MNYPVMVKRGNSLESGFRDPKAMPKTKSKPQSRLKPKSGSKSKPDSKSGSKSGSRLDSGPKHNPGPSGSRRAGGKPKVATAERSQVDRLRRKAAPKRKAMPKSADIAKLEGRLRRLRAELVRAKGRIVELEGWAETDFLLDILNRRGFERELTRAIAYIKRYPASGALIALDVDRLKPINDAFGHAAGDAVLKGIVHVILKHVRSSDVVGRLGGDEFAVLLWNLSEADALAKAHALEEAIDRLTFVFRGRSMTAGASTGVTVLVATDDAVAALERADTAMYHRKKHRRDARL